MTSNQAADPRSAALDDYVRRHRLHFLLRRFAPERAEQRLVVSVDQHGGATSQAAEPVRW